MKSSRPQQQLPPAIILAAGGMENALRQARLAPFRMPERREETPAPKVIGARDRITGEIKRTSKKLGRNDLCHCGSGLKFKKCCAD